MAALAPGRDLDAAWRCRAHVLGGLLLSHVPAIYGLALRNDYVHEAEHGLYLLTALLLWASILGVDPIPHRTLTRGPRTLARGPRGLSRAARDSRARSFALRIYGKPIGFY